MKKLYLLLMLLYSTVSFSDSMSSQNYPYFAAASIDSTWIHNKKSQTFDQNTDYEMQYVNNTHSAIPAGELFLGIQTNFTSAILSQLGVAIGQTQDLSLSGKVLEFSDPKFINFKYNYSITHTDLSIKGKWILNKDLFMNPYFSANMGRSFNRTHGFKMHPLTDEELYNPATNHRNTNAFMYAVGVGLQKILTSHCQLGIGYQFADFGQSSVIVDGNKLSNSHLHTNSLVFNMTYLF